MIDQVLHWSELISIGRKCMYHQPNHAAQHLMHLHNAKQFDGMNNGNNKKCHLQSIE